MKRLLTYIMLFSATILLLSCEDNENNGVPLVATNIIIQINDPAYQNLSTVGGWEYITGGSRGIIVYRLSTTEFKAYDRHCTFQPSSTCALVSVHPNNISATDNCCGSSFSLQNGSVTSPPAAAPLKEYITHFDGSILRITN